MKSLKFSCFNLGLNLKEFVSCGLKFIINKKPDVLIHIKWYEFYLHKTKSLSGQSIVNYKSSKISKDN